MIKRIISLFLIIFVFIFNCCPVFALDSFSSDNFLSVAKDYMTNDILNFINNDLTDKKYHFFILDRDFSRYMFILKSNTVLDYEFLSGDNSTITITNNSTEDDYLYSLPDFLYSFVVPAGESITWHPGGYNPIFYENDLLIVDGNCVSKTYCSPDIYVDLETEGDYEEDGVVIKGLTAFFNKMTSALNDILETIKGIVDSIIGIPEEGYFASKIETIKESINAKYNLDSLFGFFEDMKNIESTVPNFSFDKDLSINGQTFPFDFYIDFSWFDGEIKNIIFLLFRAVGYPLLIVYNLNQVYLLFRGRKFISEDGGEDA